MLKSRRVASINLDKSQWKLAIVSPNLETKQANLEFFGVYSDIDKLKIDLANYNISKISYSISSQYGKSFTTSLLNESNLDSEKLARHITDEHTSDYFSFGNSSILVSLVKTNLPDIAGFQPALNLKCDYLITHSDVVLTYSVLRNYSDRQRSSIAVLNFEQNHVGLIVLQNGSVKQTLWIAIKAEQDLILQLVALLKSGSRFCEQPKAISPEAGTYDLVIGAGECTIDLLVNLKASAAKHKISLREVELLDSLRSGFISTQNLATNQQLEIENGSHRYGVPIAASLMQIEQLGVDLTSNNTNVLAKRFTSQAQIKVNENLINKAIAFVVGSGKTIIPSVRAQKYLVLTITILSLMLAGYRYNNYNNKLVSLENLYSVEKVKESNLIGVKIDYELAQKRNKLKNDRISAIKTIQKTQLLVSTIFTDFQVLSYQSQFKDLVGISSMQITGSSVRISGEAIDKIGAVAFVNKVQQN
ncbi:MAG: hypothetical protein FD167_2854, partial [bacterium]